MSDKQNLQKLVQSFTNARKEAEKLTNKAEQDSQQSRTKQED